LMVGHELTPLVEAGCCTVLGGSRRDGSSPGIGVATRELR
jgi:hypothetical protein